ncbi:sensor histidine kinase [Ramlibacter sp.]|uniref:sensor histidine kinase n=1 Tax=Ramlibacter sp. TaxID=1917967 RepID=UPI003D12DC59
MGPGAETRSRLSGWLHRVLALAGLALAFASFASFAADAPVHRVSRDVERVVLSDAAWALEDPSGNLTVDAVEALGRKGGMKTVRTQRISQYRLDKERAYWTWMDIVAEPGAPEEWTLEIPRPLIQNIQVFVREGGGAWKAFPEVGAELPFDTRPVDQRFFQFPVRVKAGQTTSVMVRVRHLGNATLRVVLWQPQALQKTQLPAFAFIVVYLGLMAGMLIYNLLLYFSLRDRGYLYYVCCAGCAALGIACLAGVGQQFFWGTWTWWNTRAMWVLFALSGMFSAILTRHFLHTRERLPWGDKALKVMAWVAAVVALLALGGAHIGAALGGPTQVILTLVVTSVSVVAMVRGWPGAKYLCAAWGALYLGVALPTLRLLIPMPLFAAENAFAANSFAVGSALEMILLSFALADRINFEKRQKEDAQALALGILQASQALGKETRLDKLHARMCQIVSAISGSMNVRFVLRDPDLGNWFLYDLGGVRMPVEEAGQGGFVNLEALRAVERTHQAHEDATSLVLPISPHGALDAILSLDKPANGIAPAARAAIEGIAGPLAVSLQNALLYERLEQHVDERTRELRQTQQKLLETARRAGRAEVATNVLHNVGNTLNSVNVSAELMRSELSRSRAEGLDRVAELLKSRADGVDTFLADDPMGRQVPKYLQELSDVLHHERESMKEHLSRLVANVDHIKKIVAIQQTHAGPSVMMERVVPGDLVDEALRMKEDAIAAGGIEVVREFDDLPAADIDKTRTLQILVNLIENAAHALTEGHEGPRRVTLGVQSEPGKLRFIVRDSGRGIAPEDLSRIFSHGFTTRSGGHGFGLHSCAIAATEMGGKLSVHSDGAGQGATFVLELPAVGAREALPAPGGL